MMLTMRKLTAALCTLCLLVTCFCGIPARAAERAPGQYTGRITDLSLNEDGFFQITRQEAKCEPMGEENSWTIFVYLCGSDLESEHGCATNDLQEMIDGSAGSRVRYVVLTGGAMAWQRDYIDPESLDIFLVENGDIRLVQRAEYHYMNDPDTLYAFLSWGVKNYPADKMGVVVWDHGGGSNTGACIDRRFLNDLNSGVLENSEDYESLLTLPAFSSALSRVYDEMTDQFEFFGFDACLMGTMETAFMLSPYARYYYGSQEREPGCGWDYIAISQAIGATGEINGADLGVVVCDSFYEGCIDYGDDSHATLSCIDLAQMDDLALAVDYLGMKMLSASEDPAALAQIVQSMDRVDLFGGNSEEEGYKNQLDLAGIASVLSGFIDGAEDVLEVLHRAVVYRRNGPLHAHASGMSIYYPLHLEPGTSELGEYARVAFSPYYYGFVAENAYTASYGSLEGYDLSYSLDAWASTLDSEAETIVEQYEVQEELTGSTYVEFCDEPLLLEDGTYAFSLTDESLPYIASVEANIYFLSEDGEDLVFLGSTSDIIADWETGVFRDHFDGLWFSTPEGQLVPATLVTQTDEFSLYTTHILLNGKETNLRFVVDNETFVVTLDGIWNGMDENGLFGRRNVRLQPGDIIRSIFSATNLDTKNPVIYYGEEYTYDGSDTWYYTRLFEAKYLYQFVIHDIYGESTTTDGVFFTVTDEQILFSEN